MHLTSIKNMTNFKEKYLEDRENLKILDIGSRDICGSYKKLFEKHNYIGFDIVPGENVDVTDWKDLEGDTFDAVISGQAFEHIEDDHQVMKEIYRVMKHNALCCIIAPSKGPKHCLPDYRRYQEKDFYNLAHSAELVVLEIKIDHESKRWGDCILVATKDILLFY